MTGADVADVDADPIRLGVLGCADVAARRVLPAVAAAKDIELVAVASRRLGRAQEFVARFGGQAVGSYLELLERDDVDAVYVPLPSGLHAEWIERALTAGRHVLAEKPLTTTAADTDRLVRLAAARSLVLRENYMFRWHRQHTEVRRLIEAGTIGTVHTFTARFAIPARPAGDIRYQPRLGGGALLDTGGYPVRAAQLFLGADLAVLGAQLRHDDALGVDIGGAALLAAPDGVSAQLSFGLRHAYHSEYEFHGSDGRLALEHAFTPPAEHVPVVRLIRDGHREQRRLPPDDQFLRSVEAFAQAVRGGAAPDPYLLRQANLIDTIRRSVRERCA